MSCFHNTARALGGVKASLVTRGGELVQTAQGATAERCGPVVYSQRSLGWRRAGNAAQGPPQLSGKSPRTACHLHRESRPGLIIILTCKALSLPRVGSHLSVYPGGKLGGPAALGKASVCLVCSLGNYLLSIYYVAGSVRHGGSVLRP